VLLFFELTNDEKQAESFMPHRESGQSVPKKSMWWYQVWRYVFQSKLNRKTLGIEGDRVGLRVSRPGEAR